MGRKLESVRLVIYDLGRKVGWGGVGLVWARQRKYARESVDNRDSVSRV